jgi:hypothetical protein
MKEENDGVFFFPSRKKGKKKTQRKKMQRRVGAYPSSFASTFGMKRSSCLLLSTSLRR